MRILNLALTKMLTDRFRLLLTYIYMTYVTRQFFPCIFFWPRAKNLHFPRWPPKKLVGMITYEPLVGLLSNSVGLFSTDLINFWDESIKNKMDAAAI